MQAEHRDRARRSRVERADVGERTHSQQVRRQPDGAAPVERKAAHARFGGARDEKKSEPDQDRDDQLPDDSPAGKEQDLAGDDERSGCEQPGDGEPERSWSVGVLESERAERERRDRVGDDGRCRDETDQLLPAGKGKEEEHPAHKGERDRHQRCTSGREPPERRRDVAVPRQRERQATTGPGVEKAGAGGRGDRV